MIFRRLIDALAAAARKTADRLGHVLDDKTRLIKALCAFLAGGYLAATEQMGDGLGFVPMAALVCALPAGYGAAAIAAGAIWSFAAGINTFSASVLAAAVCVWLVRLWFGNAYSKSYSVACAAVAGLTFLGGRITALAASDAPAYAYLVEIARSCLCTAGAYLFASVFKTPSPDDVAAADKPRLYAMTVAAVCMLCPVFLGQTLSLLIPLCVFYTQILHGRARSGALGAILSLGVSLYSGSLELSGLCFALFALLCPPFIAKRKVPCAACFFGAMLIMCAFYGDSYDLAAALSSAAAAVLFALMPDKRLNAVGKLYSSAADAQACVPEGLAKLDFVRDGLQKLSDDCKSENMGELLSVSDMVYASVCAGCPQHEGCYSGDARQKAQRMLSSLDGAVSGGDFRVFAPFCSQSSEISAAAAKAKKRLGYMSLQRAADDERLSGVESALDAVIAATDSQSKDSDEDAGKALASELKAYGMPCFSCAVDLDGCADVYFSAEKRVSQRKLLSAAERALKRKLSVVSQSGAGGYVKYTLLPRERFEIEAGAYRIPKQAGVPPADAVAFFEYGKYSYAALSDGMGTGREAAKSAETLLKTLKTLICSGIGEREAAALCSERLKCIRGDESFATLDLLRVNLASGGAEIFKFGASASVAVGDKMRLISGGGYPLGIIDELSATYAKIDGEEGGVCIAMLTDGAGSPGAAEIAALVIESSELSCEEAAAAIAHRAFSKNKQTSPDDVTAAIVRIKRKSDYNA